MGNALVNRAKPLLAPFFVSSAKRKLENKRDWDGPAWHAIRTGLLQALNREIDPQEAAWIQKIESLRRDLESSSETVELSDFGAGRRDELDARPVRSERVGDICRKSSKPPFWALILFKIIRNAAPQRCIELGSCLAISASYQGAALALNGSGHLTTCEGSPALARLARRNIEAVGLSDRIDLVEGRFDDTLDGILASGGAVDYAFIDGHHEEAATIRYFERLKPKLAENAILVFDDIAWSDGMKRAWKRVQDAPEISTAVDLRAVGVAVYSPNARKQGCLNIPMI